LAKDSVIKRDEDIEVTDSKADAVKGGVRYDPIGDGTSAPAVRTTAVHSRKTHKAKSPGKPQRGMGHL
jgi:hypothetical protein